MSVGLVFLALLCDMLFHELAAGAGISLGSWSRLSSLYTYDDWKASCVTSVKI